MGIGKLEKAHLTDPYIRNKGPWESFLVTSLGRAGACLVVSVGTTIQLQWLVGIV